MTKKILKPKNESTSDKKASDKTSKLLSILEPISKNIEKNESFNRKVAKLGILVNSNLITK